jgi:hypothetical protein
MKPASQPRVTANVSARIEAGTQGPQRGAFALGIVFASIFIVSMSFYYWRPTDVSVAGVAVGLAGTIGSFVYIIANKTAWLPEMPPTDFTMTGPDTNFSIRTSAAQTPQVLQLLKDVVQGRGIPPKPDGDVIGTAQDPRQCRLYSDEEREASYQATLIQIRERDRTLVEHLSSAGKKPPLAAPTSSPLSQGSQTPEGGSANTGSLGGAQEMKEHPTAKTQEGAAGARRDTDSA